MTSDGAGAEAPRVIAIFGPTGVGKTAVAIALADELRARGEDPLAVSADALQVYQGLGTLTGAATDDEQARLEHRLVGVVPVSETFSAGEFARRAHAEIDAALAARRAPLVVGGTGLYLQAALCELDLRPPPPPALRARLSGRVEREGAAALHAELVERDPAAAEAIVPTDRTRVIRALELLDQGEAPPATGDDSRLWTAAMRHPTLLVGLTLDRERLYEQINARCEQIVAAGAPEEVRVADAAGASHTARKALGFEELLAGDVEAMKRRTRNYAKRQLAWMRKLDTARLIATDGRTPADVAGEIARAARGE